MTTYNLLESNVDQRPDNGWLHGVIAAWGPDGGPFNLISNSNPLPVTTNAINQALTLLASAARTTLTDSPVQTNNYCRGVQLVLKVTAVSGSGGLLVRLIGNDPVAGPYYLNTAPTTITAIGTYVIELYPGASTTPPGVANAVYQRTAGSLPYQWNGRVEVVDGSSYTYSLSASTIL